MPDPVRSLIERWRREADQVDRHDGDFCCAETIRSCIAELSAALAAVPRDKDELFIGPDGELWLELPGPKAALTAAPPPDPVRSLADAAEMLWVVLANVSGGDWTQQTAEWQEAAARWRDNYFAALKGAAVETSEKIICACGTTMICPDIGCDLHKVPDPAALAAVPPSEQELQIVRERVRTLERANQHLQAALDAVELSPEEGGPDSDELSKELPAPEPAA